MEGVNARVVMRSAHLLNWGSAFCYWEGQGTGLGWAGWFKAQVGRLALIVIGSIIAIKPLQTLLAFLFPTLLPKQGEGPSEALMTGGFFSMGFIAVPSGSKEEVVRGLVADPHRDPGYWSTSRMVLEAALCLALDEDKVKAGGASGGGVLTSASGLGMPLIERLRNAGYVFKIVDDKKVV